MFLIFNLIFIDVMVEISELRRKHLRNHTRHHQLLPIISSQLWLHGWSVEASLEFCLRLIEHHIIFHRDWPVDKLKEVKVADALKHPNWNMGEKITVDSATLFNKV